MPKDVGLDLQTPQQLGHLPVIMGIIRRTGILDLIDHAITERMLLRRACLLTPIFDRQRF
jgi:hypothetical protein